MKNLRAARRYALALFKAAREKGGEESVRKDVEGIARVLAHNRDLILMVESPVVPQEKKLAVFRELFGKTVGATTLSFLELLVEKRREGVLGEVIAEYSRLCDADEGVVEVDVRSAVPLTESQHAALVRDLEHRTGKRVRMRVTRDEGLRGGVVVKIGDTVLDGSIAHQLELLRQRLAGAPAGPQSHAH